MDRGTLSDPQVARVIAGGAVVPLRIYVDQYPDQCRDYRVPNPELRDEDGFAPYPSLQVWTPSGVLVTRLDGAQAAGPFVLWLSQAIEDWPAVADEERALLEKSKAQPGLLSTLGGFYSKKKTYRMAAEAYVKLSRHPKLKAANRHLFLLKAGHAYLMHASYELANQFLKLAAVEGANTREKALGLLGFSCLQAGLKDDARRHYKALLLEFPGSRSAPAARKVLGSEKVYY